VAAIGLKLKLRDGTECVTVPTHAFVDLGATHNKGRLKLTNWFLKAQEFLLKLRPIQQLSRPAVAGTRGAIQKTPLGKGVWLADTNEKVSQSLTYFQRVLTTKRLITDRHHHSNL
jgi:hypothetical protein